MNRFDESIQFFDKSIELKPKKCFAYYNKGNSLYKLNRYQESIEYFDKAIEIKPDHAMAYNNKGSI